MLQADRVAYPAVGLFMGVTVSGKWPLAYQFVMRRRYRGNIRLPLSLLSQPA